MEYLVVIIYIHELDDWLYLQQNQTTIKRALIPYFYVDFGYLNIFL
jgi:hypothetical protein